MLKILLKCTIPQILAILCLGGSNFTALKVDVYTDTFCLDRPSYLYADIYWEEGTTGKILLTFVEDYETYSEPRLYDERLINFDEDNMFYYVVQIPYYYMTSKAGFTIEVVTYSNQIGSGARQYTGYFSGFLASLHKELYITESGTYDMGRNAIRKFANDDLKVGNEIYKFYHITEHNDGGRRSGLIDIYFEYECYGLQDYFDELDYEDCYIKILSHPQDYQIGEYISGAREIPAKIVYRKPKTFYTNLQRNVFQIVPEDKFYVDAKTFRSYESPEHLDKYFTTEELMVPLFTGHEEDPFKFQVVINGLGTARDNIVMERTFNPGKRKFGNCFDSEYCVIMGN